MEDKLDRGNRTRRLPEAPDDRWHAVVSRAVPRWNRGAVDTGWEKGLLLVAALLIGSALTGSVIALTRTTAGGSSGKHVTFAGLVPATASQPVPPTPITSATAAQPPALALADRADCETIRGTDYNSNSERVFFQQQCLTSAPLGPREPPLVDAPPSSVPTNAPPSEPTEPSTPPGTFGAGDAITLAVDWITHSAPVAYTTDGGLCNVINTGGHWVVTCNARLVGCAGDNCQYLVSVCVFADPQAVRTSDQC